MRGKDEDKKPMNNHIIFWGTGNIGHNMLELWNMHGLKPDYFCDNRSDNFVRRIDGIEIISPDDFQRLDNVTVFITCDAVSAIKNQIKAMHIHNVKVIDGSSVYSHEMMCYLYQFGSRKKHAVKETINSNQCLFDFTYGTNLGGVQNWSYVASEVLQRIGIDGKYIMPDNMPNGSGIHAYRHEVVTSNELTIYDAYIDAYVDYIMKADAKYIICSFPREIFYAAAIVKRLYKQDLFIVAVVHSHDNIYYDSYKRLSFLINKFIVISEMMKNKMVSMGIPDSMLIATQWNVPTCNIDTKAYTKSDEKIRIGYAGRIVIQQKRLDLLLDVAEKLVNKEIYFILDLVGSGVSEDYIKNEIQCRHLENIVHYLGIVPHDKITDFWIRHDIYISCSECEGHSISQYEAMANGAVPVVTHTSGTDDDIKDGWNGFIVDIGDVDGLVEKIEYLYHNREQLSIMGRRSINLINKRNQEIDEIAFWREVLELDESI